MCENTVRARIRLAGHFQDYPELEEEYLGRKLSQEQVMLLGKVFDAGTDRREQWIGYAQEVPVLELRGSGEQFLRMAESYRPEVRTVTPWELHRGWDSESGIRGVGAIRWVAHRTRIFAEEHGLSPGTGNWGDEEGTQTCGRERRGSDFGVRGSGEEEKKEEPQTCGPAAGSLTLRFYVQGGLKELWGVAARFYREHCNDQGKAPCLAGFVETLLDNFLDTWCNAHATGVIHELPLQIRHRILARDGYRCQVPGCSCRRFLEVHHIIYRSQGGSNDHNNLITLCGFHHRQCLHNGYIIIKGNAPGELFVILGIYRENNHPATSLEMVPSLARFQNGIRIRHNLPPPDCSAA
jgi:hypothetical protein